MKNFLLGLFLTTSTLATAQTESSQDDKLEQKYQEYKMLVTENFGDILYPAIYNDLRSATEMRDLYLDTDTTSGLYDYYNLKAHFYKGITDYFENSYIPHQPCLHCKAEYVPALEPDFPKGIFYKTAKLALRLKADVMFENHHFLFDVPNMLRPAKSGKNNKLKP